MKKYNGDKGSEQPKVSIIVPTFNRAKYLERAIESALDQDYKNIEVIVSDNASTDSTWSVVCKYKSDPRFSGYRNKENVGMVNNWKYAVEERVSGSWFMILSDDDYLIDNGYITKAMSIASENDSVSLIFAGGFISHIGESKADERCIPLDLPFERITRGREVFVSRGRGIPQDFILCNVLFKRDLALDMNPFGNPNNLSCDTELFLMMCIVCDVGVIKDRVSVYSVHDNNLLKAAAMDFNYLLGSLDALLRPYETAKNVLDKSDVEKFVGNSGIANAIRYVTVMTLLDHPACYDRLQSFLKDIDTTLVDQAYSDWRSRFIVMLCQRAPRVARFLRSVKRNYGQV